MMDDKRPTVVLVWDAGEQYEQLDALPMRPYDGAVHLSDLKQCETVSIQTLDRFTSSHSNKLQKT